MPIPQISLIHQIVPNHDPTCHCPSRHSQQWFQGQTTGRRVLRIMGSSKLHVGFFRNCGGRIILDARCWNFHDLESAGFPKLHILNHKRPIQLLCLPPTPCGDAQWWSGAPAQQESWLLLKQTKISSRNGNRWDVLHFVKAACKWCETCGIALWAIVSCKFKMKLTKYSNF